MRTAFPLGETNLAGAPQARAQGAPADHCQAVCGTSLGLDTPSPERYLEADVGVMQMFGPCLILPTCAEVLAYLDRDMSFSMKLVCLLCMRTPHARDCALLEAFLAKFPLGSFYNLY